MAKKVTIHTIATATVHEEWTIVVPDDVEVTVDNWDDVINGVVPSVFLGVRNVDVTDERERDLDQIGDSEPANTEQAKALALTIDNRSECLCDAVLPCPIHDKEN